MQETSTDPAITPASLLSRLGLGGKQSQEKKGSKETSIQKVAEGGGIPATPPASTGTASLRLDQTTPSTPPTTQSSKQYPAPSALSIRCDELQTQITESQEKYKKLDELFNEKSAALEKAEKSLVHEEKARKEFNKVKDMLEKELKDTKDHTRDLQIKVTSAQTEAQSYLNRINQLEERIKNNDKVILEHGDKEKRLSTEKNSLNEQIEKLRGQLKSSEDTIGEKNAKIANLVEKIKDLSAGAKTESTETEKKLAEAPSSEEPEPTEEQTPEKAAQDKTQEEGATTEESSQEKTPEESILKEAPQDEAPQKETAQEDTQK